MTGLSSEKFEKFEKFEMPVGLHLREGKGLESEVGEVHEISKKKQRQCQ